MANVFTGYLPTVESSSGLATVFRGAAAAKQPRRATVLWRRSPSQSRWRFLLANLMPMEEGALHRFYTPSEPSPHMRGARSIPTTPTETAALRGVFGFSGEGFCWPGRARCFRGTVPTVGARDSVGKGDRTTRPSNQIRNPGARLGRECAKSPAETTESLVQRQVFREVGDESG